MRTFLSRKQKEPEISEILTEIVHRMGRHIAMIAEFATSPGLMELLGQPAQYMIVFKENSPWGLHEVAELFQQSSVVPFVLDSAELESYKKIFPIELVHIRNNYSLSYGDDLLASLDIEKDDLKRALIKEVNSVILQVRAGLIGNGDSREGKAILARMIPVCKALLSLRGISIPLTTATLLSEVESCYTFSEFPLSGMVELLERDINASLRSLFISIHSVLITLRSTLVEGE